MGKQKTVKVFFVGFGLIGQERFKSIQDLLEKGKKIQITGIYDPFFRDKEKFTKEYKAKFLDRLEDGLKDKPDWAFVAVPHDDAVKITQRLLKTGINVLMEKPLGRNIREAKKIVGSTVRKNQLWVGFNYRFFEGLAKAIKDAKDGKFGKLISVNIEMGHGCHPDITKGWKLDPVKAGGGAMIDPGIHLLDLCRIIADDKLKVKCGSAWKGFWKTGIEEECHLLLEGKKFIINFQVSVVKWRSTFRMEINGDKGYAVIEGRNRSYGKQTYTFGPRWGWQKAASQKDSEKVISESTGEDVFTKEIDALLFSTKHPLKPCSASEALENMKILEQCRKALRI